MDYLRYISRDQGTCGGEAVVSGTRVTVRTLLATLAEGVPISESMVNFPTLTEEQIRGIIAYAADSAREDLPLPATPQL